MRYLRKILRLPDRRRLMAFCSSLRVRLPLRVMLVTLPAVMALMITLDHLVAEQLIESVQNEMLQSCDALADAVDRWDDAIADPLLAVAANPDITSMDPARQRHALQLAAAASPNILWWKTSTPDGLTLARSDDQPTTNFGDRTWFRRAMAGEQLTRQAVISRTAGQAVVVYATPIRDAKDRIVGVLSAAADLNDLGAIVRHDQPRVGRWRGNGVLDGLAGYRAVFDQRGQLLAHPDMSAVMALQSMIDVQPVRMAVLSRLEVASDFTDDQGEVWLTRLRPLGNGWTVMTARRQSSVLGQMATMRAQAISVAAATGLAVVLLAALSVGRIVRTVTRLTRVATAVAEGDFEQRAEEHGRDELATLARSMNAMVSRLQEGLRTIEQKVERRTQALRMRNAELTRARLAAEQAAQLKDEFLANMSHEIRTPLTAILGYAELLVDMQMSEAERAKALQSIHDNGQHLLNVINDVLDIAKLEASKMEVERIQVPPTILINDVLTLLRSKAEEKSLKLDVEYASPLPELIETDPTRLKQILMNLIGNAIKYTEQGQVLLTVRLIEGMQDNETFLQFDVTDTGIGMEQEQLDRLFKPFSQGCVSTSRRFGGTGLGLVISQKLARLLGGDISVTSKFGEGSTFTLIINIGPTRGARMMSPQALMHDSVAAIPVVEDEQSFALCHARVLLADDNPSSRLPIAATLRAAGAEVTEATNGKIACHKVMEAFQALQPFDVVLMDIRMPELDGVQAVRQLRKLGYPGPVIALTASIRREERDACLRAGFSDFAQKPLPRDKLTALVAKWRHAKIKTPKPFAA